MPAFVTSWSVESATRTAVAIGAEDAPAAIEALARNLADHAVCSSVHRTNGQSSEIMLASELTGERADGVAVIRTWRFYVDPAGSLVYGRRYACDLEMWRTGFIDGHRTAPRPNVVAQILPESELEPVEVNLFVVEHLVPVA